MKKYSRLAIFSAIIFGIIIGLVITSPFEKITPVKAEQSNTSPNNITQAQSEIGLVRQLNNVFTAIAKKANPSVVTILTDKVIKQPVGNSFFSPDNDSFRRFFGEDFFNRFYRQQDSEREQHLRGMGSGVIVRKNGVILTNNHVIRDADNIMVLFQGGKRMEANIVGTDAKTDIAVLQVDKNNLIPIILGNSDQLQVGEWILAIGSPLSENLAHTVTAGIVSAKGRANVGLASYEDFIQTDAAINPGNSGGALINLDGKLVGINTAIASQSGGFQGIGFAVPINMASSVMESLIKEGKVVRGWLGVLIQDIDENLAKALNSPDEGGVLIADVVENGPSEEAGIESGDVVSELDGKEINNATQLRNDIASRSPGENVKLKIIRNEKEQIITVKLSELPEESEKPKPGKNLSDRIGLNLKTLNDQMASMLGFEKGEKGVVVIDTDPNSAAYRSGVRRGDLIKEINRKRITDINDFSEVVSKLKAGDTVLLHARRQSNHFYVAFEIN